MLRIVFEASFHIRIIQNEVNTQMHNAPTAMNLNLVGLCVS